jgi:molybdenum cofactor synthesis domain-containing protein
LKIMVKRKLFHILVPIEKAIEIVESRVELRPRGVEVVKLLDTLGRVLAEDIYAPIDYPPFDRSEVDGYAVRAEDTYGASDIRPLSMKVIGVVKVGEEPRIEVKRGEAIEISTGAPIPRGCNAVVMEEHTTRENELVYVYRTVAPLENISVAGSDVARGELIIPKGTRLEPFEIGVLAALGYESVKVYLKPKVAVISTGIEIVKPGSKLEYGQIYDYNGYALTAYLKSLGTETDYLGIVPDDEDELKKIILNSIEKYDLVVTSGGTSAGIGDIVYRVIEDLGEILVHGLEVKPGKPTVIGVVKEKLVVGLPGFPFSALTHSLTLLRYIVEKISGIEYPILRPSIKAKIAQSLRKEVGKDLYIPVVLTYRGSNLIAIPVPSKSGNISSLLRSNGIAVISRGREIVEEGEDVDVIVLRYIIPEMVVIGSHDIILPSIINVLGLTNKYRFIPVGSLAGLISVSKGYGDVAPIHLLDPITRKYNVEYVKQYKDVVLISGYRRRLVLAYRPGNPKNIRGFEDLLRPDVRFVNRNRGSGTRVYIDMVLKDIAVAMGIEFHELIQRINGYTYEVSSHTGVAAAIAQGRADVGVCVEYAAKIYGLEYKPLTWEEYDFAVHIQSLETKDTVKLFVEALKSPYIKKFVSSYPGYEPKEDMGEIIHVNR